MTSGTRICGRLSATRVLSQGEVENVAGGWPTQADSFCQRCAIQTSAGGDACWYEADDCAPD